MSEQEAIKLYGELLWWFLVLLASGGIPLALGGIAAMVLRIRMMDDMLRGPPMAPPPPRWPHV